MVGPYSDDRKHCYRTATKPVWIPMMGNQQQTPRKGVQDIDLDPALPVSHNTTVRTRSDQVDA